MIPLQACPVPKYTKSEYTTTQIQLPLLLNSKYHHSVDLWQTTAIFEPLPTSAIFDLPQAAPKIAYIASVNDSILQEALRLSPKQARLQGLLHTRRTSRTSQE